MSFKVQEVKKYNYAYDARIGSPGRLQLWGDKKKIAEIKFVEDNATVPAPILSPDLTSARAFFKRSSLPGLIDMLRNESPVKVTINNQGPGFVFVHTGMEPVGEEEEMKKFKEKAFV